MPSAFHPAAIDPEDPFEIDAANRPHLFKHHGRADGRVITLSEADIYDVFHHDPQFRPASHGPAEWLMMGEVPGGLVLVVPLAPARSDEPSKCRPIGVYQATSREVAQYRAWQQAGE